MYYLVLLQAQGSSPEGKLTLMEGLRACCCLLILDNADEAILSTTRQIGQYRSGYEGYGQLLKAIGEVCYQSCLLLTSCEKPKKMCPWKVRDIWC